MLELQTTGQKPYRRPIWTKMQQLRVFKPGIVGVPIVGR
jgi:hypothetical protein